MNWWKVLLKALKGVWISGGAALAQTWLTGRGMDPGTAAMLITAAGGAIMGGDNIRKNRKAARKA
jgi:hypothetical protein